MQNTWSVFLQNTMNFISETSENVQKTINQMIADRKLTLEEGKKAYEDFLKNTEGKREEFEQQVIKVFEKFAKNIHLVTQKELEELRNQVNELEKRVQTLENNDPQKAQ